MKTPFLLSVLALFVAIPSRAADGPGISGGLIVVAGCDDPRSVSALRANESCVVQALDTDPKKVAGVRAYLLAQELYGPASARTFDGRHLPYENNLVNLYVQASSFNVDQSEIERVLAPGGCAVSSTGAILFRKLRPSDIDEWPQYLHGADNNAVARDRVVGPPRHMQWVTNPKWSRSHMTIPTVCSMVTAKGRLFTIEDEATCENPFLPGQFFLVARDAFNGIVLWQHAIHQWEPVTRYVKDMAVQLQKRMVAVGDVLYCAAGLNAPITEFDAATGKILKVFGDTHPTRELAYEDGILYAVIGDAMNAARYDIVKDYGGKGKYLGGADPGAPFKGTGFRGQYAPQTQNKRVTQCVIAAIDASSGKQLWRTGPLRDYTAATLSIKADKAVFMTAAGLTCLNAKTGTELWHLNKAMRDGDGTQPNVVVITDSMVYAKAGELTAYSLADGSEKWTTKAPDNYEKPADVFVVGDAVWVGGRGVPTSYDAATGKFLKRLTQGMTGPMGHDRCYRNFITVRYYINSKTGGADFVRLDNSGEFPNYWTRGTCGMGVLPANGLLYVPPFSCECSMGAMINSFNALATEPGIKRSDQPVKVERKARLIGGPAYSETPNSQRTIGQDDWPTYRHDSTRGGSTKAHVPSNLAPTWKTRLPTKPSAPILADGKIFVAAVDADTLYALEAASGRKVWTYVAGGRIDSPPTYWKGLLLFGSRDGWVYCVRAADGVLAWKFKDLPSRLICAYGQLESAWPVHGSVLIVHDTAYFDAGRSSFLDGGIFLYALNPLTGKVLHTSHTYGPFDKPDGFPDTRKGFKADVMVADATQLYIRHKAYKPDLTDSNEFNAHIVPSASFLDDVPQHRTCWMYGSGGPLQGSMVTTIGRPHGDIMVTDAMMYYAVKGFPVTRHSYFDPRLRGYSLVAGSLEGYGPARRRQRVKDQNKWAVNIPITGNAMIKAGGKLFVAGKKVEYPVGMFKELSAGYEGKSGGVLWVASAEDGQKLAEYHLDAPPVWDGMAATRDRVVISLQDGTVQCLAGQ